MVRFESDLKNLSLTDLQYYISLGVQHRFNIFIDYTPSKVIKCWK